MESYIYVLILSLILLVILFVNIKLDKKNKSLRKELREYSSDNIELREIVKKCRETKNLEDYYCTQLDVANKKIKEFEGLSPKHSYTICFENEYEGGEDYNFETIEANYPVVSQDGSMVYFKLDGRIIAQFNDVKYWKEEL
jgi:hypothetical protein